MNNPYIRRLLGFARPCCGEQPMELRRDDVYQIRCGTCGYNVEGNDIHSLLSEWNAKGDVAEIPDFKYIAKTFI